MAEELSQATAEPTVTAVLEQPQQTPVEGAEQQAVPAPASTEVAKMTLDEYRDKLKSGELRKEVKDSGLDIGDYVSKYVDSGEGLGQEAKPAAEPTADKPTPEPVKPEPKPKQSPAPRKDANIKDVQTFIKALQSRGFNYDTIDKALDGYINKEAAVTLYRQESRKFRSDFEAAKVERDQYARQVAEMKRELDEVKSTVAKKVETVPVVKVEIPEIPEIPSVGFNDTDDEKLSQYNQQIRAREEALVKEYGRVIQEQQSKFDKRLHEVNNSVEALTAEFQNQKRTNDAMAARDAKQKTLDNAFRAAEDLMGKVPKYKMGKPIEKVHAEYNDLLKDVAYVQQTTPGFAGYDLLGEYFAGNAVVQQEFARREISVSDDIQNYIVMAQLEGDAIRHNLVTNGRPDLVKALRLREEDEGIRQQEILDAKVSGYDQAQTIMRPTTTAARQMPLSAAAAPPDGPKAMDVNEVRVRLAEIKQITNKTKMAAAMKELEPHIKALQNQT